MSFEAWIIATGVLVGVSCGLIGTFLVLRSMAMLTDAISHTVLLGIVGAFLVTEVSTGFLCLRRSRNRSVNGFLGSASS